MQKKVLILVYSLSLNDGVGARRWNKYASELAKLDYKVFIVGADNYLNSNIKHQNIKYTTFKSSYPTILNTIPSNHIQKIRYRLALNLQKVLSKGATFDKASRDKQKIINTVLDVVKNNNIPNLIVTGAPFSLLYFGVLIKELTPTINLISDIRDAWSWGHGYGINLLKGKKRKFEFFQESEVIAKSDFVTVASEDLRLSLLGIYPKYKDKISVLLNGVNFNSKDLKFQEDTGKINILHIGSVNVGLEEYWKPFLSFIKGYEKLIELTFIGGCNKLIESYVLNEEISNVKFAKHLPELELASYFKKTNFALMFKKDGFENSFPTKFFDYIKYDKQIIAFSKPGIVTQEITNNGLGKVFQGSFNKEEMILFLKESLEINYDEDYDKNKFSLENLVLNIDSKLK